LCGHEVTPFSGQGSSVENTFFFSLLSFFPLKGPFFPRLRQQTSCSFFLNRSMMSNPRIAFLLHLPVERFHFFFSPPEVFFRCTPPPEKKPSFFSGKAPALPPFSFFKPPRSIGGPLTAFVPQPSCVFLSACFSCPPPTPFLDQKGYFFPILAAVPPVFSTQPVYPPPPTCSPFLFNFGDHSPSFRLSVKGHGALLVRFLRNSVAL